MGEIDALRTQLTATETRLNGHKQYIRELETEIKVLRNYYNIVATNISSPIIDTEYTVKLIGNILSASNSRIKLE
jgi:hypothetical protein